jgi:hypothetical protein
MDATAFLENILSVGTFDGTWKKFEEIGRPTAKVWNKIDEKKLSLEDINVENEEKLKDLTANLILNAFVLSSFDETMLVLQHLERKGDTLEKEKWTALGTDRIDYYKEKKKHLDIKPRRKILPKLLHIYTELAGGKDYSARKNLVEEFGRLFNITIPYEILQKITSDYSKYSIIKSLPKRSWHDYQDKHRDDYQDDFLFSKRIAMAMPAEKNITTFVTREDVSANISHITPNCTINDQSIFLNKKYHNIKGIEIVQNPNENIIEMQSLLP